MINLAVENITLSYNHHPVVEDFSFTLQPGEIVGLIGPNGCGKTSIIKAVSRILGLKSGTIKLNGEDIYLYPRSNFARILGVVPQNPFIPDTFTVFEVVLLGRNPHLGMFRTESTHDMAVVWKAMKQTGVDALAARRMGGAVRRRKTACYHRPRSGSGAFSYSSRRAYRQSGYKPPDGNFEINKKAVPPE